MIAMPRTTAHSRHEPENKLQAAALGSRIRAARHRRRLRLEDLAEKAGISRTTVEAVERGALTTSLGAYLAVLAALGLSRELDIVADPGLDRDGLSLEFSIPEKRVRLPRKDLDNDF
jgi:transcriptional regulator with XRE-family HTH domain